MSLLEMMPCSYGVALNACIVHVCFCFFSACSCQKFKQDYFEQLRFVYKKRVKKRKRWHQMKRLLRVLTTSTTPSG
jgi:hypothetical protein